MTKIQGWLLLAVVTLCAGVYLWGQMDHRSSVQRAMDDGAESMRQARAIYCGTIASKFDPEAHCPR